jgi:thiol-disulfide isomerase/thioredoxin
VIRGKVRAVDGRLARQREIVVAVRGRVAISWVYMKRAWRFTAGGLQVALAGLLTIAVVRMASQVGPLLWRVAPLPLALAGAAVVLGAVVTCGLNGIRTLTGARMLGGWRKLPLLSGVLGSLTVALFSGDIIYTETRPRTGNARETALGRPASLLFTALDGRPVDVGAVRGRVTLVFCWATWCGPCKAEMPGIAALERKWSARGFEVVGINFDEDRRAVENFVQAHGLRWPQHFEGKPLRENSFAAKYEITGIPQLWIVDKRGIVRDVEGYVDLTAKVERLLAE